MSDLGAMAVFSGVIGVGGTLVGGPVLRLVRWADWKTSFQDAIHVSVCCALLTISYFHLATRVEAFRANTMLSELGVYGASDRAGWVTVAVAALSLIAGYALLRRHDFARSVFSALFVIGAFVGCGAAIVFVIKL